MGRQGLWLWVQVVHHFGLAMDNYVLAETNHHDVERERRSGQSGHVEALELDIDEGPDNYAAWLPPVVTYVNEAQCTAFSFRSERKETRDKFSPGVRSHSLQKRACGARLVFPSEICNFPQEIAHKQFRFPVFSVKHKNT